MLNIRSQFPALQRQFDGKNTAVFLDGPAGVQVPRSVIEAVVHYYEHSNANTHGQFATSRETDELLEEVRQKAAAFVGASDWRCISFGQNMTTLNYALSRAIGKVLQPGDEILITQLDHESNRGPWLALRERGIVVREVRLLPDGTLDYDDMAAKIGERTRLVAMGWASNIFGTVNDVQLARRLSHAYGAWLLIDAVHYAPHLPMDVQAVDCDFLLCSAYKFYGPHVGILYTRPDLLNRLPTYSLRTQDQVAPYKIETGTLNHAAIAGVGAATDFIASLGQGEDYRSRLLDAMHKIRSHERTLVKALYDGLSHIDGLKIYGPPLVEWRCPTLSFTVEDKTATEVCQALAQRGIFAWDGHFYAVRATEVLGLSRGGGVTRMGISAYTNEEDVERAVVAMEQICA